MDRVAGGGHNTKKHKAQRTKRKAQSTKHYRTLLKYVSQRACGHQQQHSAGVVGGRDTTKHEATITQTFDGS